ncbi:conserved Plasmodium protein, unknown function [Plasmodium gallinaceum]|uniref:Uncharacterized protein n=1 Tax=Plasmodium gallinaceum TaxID=5849 RepID=A0A1J1GTK2_PLAGA|nr:conserved Plasmodium protein, unknown function [Plasmodium gallinaceum]CRG95562.1 conserved Plasmodium protein, unknown function [Plasmodium gallinaceum]
MENNSKKKNETIEELNEAVTVKCEEKNDNNDLINSNELNEKNNDSFTDQNTSVLISNENEKKFMRDSSNLSFDKNLFSAPKYHPHFLLKNYTVQYMEPVIKKAKEKTFLCCC